MSINIQAIYEGGLLRPLAPLALAEGETVDLIVAQPQSSTVPLSDDEITRRLKDAKSIAEWVEATKLLPADDGGYDIVQALNENRIRSGEVPLIPNTDWSHAPTELVSVEQ